MASRFSARPAFLPEPQSTRARALPSDDWERCGVCAVPCAAVLIMPDFGAGRFACPRTRLALVPPETDGCARSETLAGTRGARRLVTEIAGQIVAHGNV